MKNWEIWISRALRSFDVPRALGFADEFVADMPDDAHVHFTAAAHHRLWGDSTRASELARRAAELDPDLAIDLCADLHHLGLDALCVDITSAVLERSSDNQVARWYRSVALGDLGRFEEAVIDAHLVERSLVETVLNHIGYLELAQGHVDAARNALEAEVELLRDANALHSLATLHLRTGAWDSAASLILEALALPRGLDYEPGWWVDLAACQARLGDSESSLASLARARAEVVRPGRVAQRMQHLAPLDGERLPSIVAGIRADAWSRVRDPAPFEESRLFRAPAGAPPGLGVWDAVDAMVAALWGEAPTNTVCQSMDAFVDSAVVAVAEQPDLGVSAGTLLIHGVAWGLGGNLRVVRRLLRAMADAELSCDELAAQHLKTEVDGFDACRRRVHLYDPIDACGYAAVARGGEDPARRDAMDHTAFLLGRASRGAEIPVEMHENERLEASAAPPWLRDALAVAVRAAAERRGTLPDLSDDPILWDLLGEYQTEDGLTDDPLTTAAALYATGVKLVGLGEPDAAHAALTLAVNVCDAIAGLLNMAWDDFWTQDLLLDIFDAGAANEWPLVCRAVQQFFEGHEVEVEHVLGDERVKALAAMR